jgi:hypothetical protein
MTRRNWEAPHRPARISKRDSVLGRDYLIGRRL